MAGPPPRSSSQAEVAARLEAIWPGLRAYALARQEASNAARAAFLARAKPGTPPRFHAFDPDLLALGVDRVVDHARASGGEVIADRLGEPPPGLPSFVLAHRVLRGLWQLDEDVLVVTHAVRCYRLAAAALVEFVMRPRDAAGERSLEGDELFVCTASRRALAVHHEGWVFDLRGP